MYEMDEHSLELIDLLKEESAMCEGEGSGALRRFAKPYYSDSCFVALQDIVFSLLDKT